MFITREEALARLNHKDNPFSPSRRGGADWGRVVEEIEDEETPPVEPGMIPVEPNPNGSHPPSAAAVSIPQAEADQSSSEADPSAQEIRQILKAVDPAVARDRSKTLHGNIAVQAAIGETALIVGPRIAGAIFDRSEPQTTAYREGHGHHKSLYGAEKGPPKPQLVERLDSFKEKLAYAAGRVLETALDNLDTDKISKMKEPVSISRVAKDMAVVMDKVSKSGTDEAGVHFHIYRPDMKGVSAYETVKIGSAGLIPSSSGNFIDVVESRSD